MPDRIAVLFEYSTLNGGERSMLQCLDCISTTEFEIVAIAPTGGLLPHELSDRQIEHHEFTWHADGVKLPPDRLCDQLRDIVVDVDPTLVHANSLSAGRLTGAAQHLFRAPTTSHLRDILRLSTAAVRDLNRNRQLFAVSAATREFHIGQGLDPTRTTVIYNGIDTDRFCPRERRCELHGELGLPESSFIVTTIGQLGLRKGQDVLAAAALRIVQQVPHVHFVLIGERNSNKSESIKFEERLVTDFNEGGLAGRAHFLGYRHDVADILADSDLLVHPAKQEPLGRVLLEAAATGTPILATDVGGTGEILQDGVSARLIAPADAAELAAGVIALAADRELRQRFATNARKQILERFTAERAAAALCQRWRSVLRS